MINFTFHAPTRILFGKDKIHDIRMELPQWGNRALLVYGGGSIKKSGLYDKVTNILKDTIDSFVELSGVQPNPRISTVREGIKLVRENNLDFILAVGGGSVIDCAKAISAGVNYDGDPWDFLMRKAKVSNAIPIGAVLTLSATGSEMNGGSVITNDETMEKRPFSDENLKPKFSVLDPTLTYSVSKFQTAAGTCDMISHILESYFSSVRDAFIQDRLAEGLLKTAMNFGPIAMNEPENYEARANLMWVSSMAINGLTGCGKIGDWATHMIEHEVSAVNDMTHGAGLALLTPYWMEYVLGDDTVLKFADYARSYWGLTGQNDFELARKAIKKTKEFFVSVDMPTKLSEIGFDSENFELMAEKATVFGPIGSFKKLYKEDILQILKSAY